jgi:hypothetical protein
MAARVSGRPIPHNRAPKMLAQLRAFGGPRLLLVLVLTGVILVVLNPNECGPATALRKLKLLLDGCFHCRIHLAKKHRVTINFHRPKSTLSVVRNI